MSEDECAPLTPHNVRMAKAFATPFIFKLVNNFTPDTLDQAIKNNTSIMQTLLLNPEALERFLMLLRIVPYYKKVLPCIRSKEWIDWFVNSELKAKKPDFYIRMAYDKGACTWLYRNIEEITNYLEDN